MILNIIFFGLVIIKGVYGAAKYSEEPTRYKARVAHSTEQKNRDDLAKIIRLLNGDTDQHDGHENSDNYVPKRHRLQQSSPLRPKKKAEKYEPDETFGIPGVRVHLIRNPDVLDAFVKKLRNGKSSSSSEDSSDTDTIESYFRDDIRRNAEFRVEDHGSNEDNTLQNEVIDIEFTSIPPSLEEQVTAFVPHVQPFDKNKSDDVKIESGQDDDVNGDSRFKIKSQTKNNKKKKRNNNDDWDSKPGYDWKEDHVEEKIKSHERDKMWDDSLPDKKVVKNIDWDAEVKVPKEEFVEDKNDWDMKSKWVDDAEMKPKKEAHKMDDLNRSRKQKDLWDSMELGWDKKKKKKKNEKYADIKAKDFVEDNDWNKKKTNNFGDDSWNKKIDSVDDGGWGKKKKKLDIWDEPTTKKKKTVKWEQPAKEKVDNDWDKVGRDWGGEKKENTWDDSYKAPQSSWKQKKRNQDVIYEKPSYVARIPEYHKDRGGSFQGRTPIPFVRHGIYDDKKK